MGVMKPELILKSTVPVIMAGILGVYGLIVGVILKAKGKSLKTLYITLFSYQRWLFMVLRI